MSSGCGSEHCSNMSSISQSQGTTHHGTQSRHTTHTSSWKEHDEIAFLDMILKVVFYYRCQEQSKLILSKGDLAPALHSDGRTGLRAVPFTVARNHLSHILIM